jgi:hypothetical protein
LRIWDIGLRIDRDAKFESEIRYPKSAIVRPCPLSANCAISETARRWRSTY